MSLAATDAAEPPLEPPGTLELLTGLRTIWGVDLDLIKKRFGVDLEGYNKNYIQDLIKLDLATFNNGKIQLSKKGILIADKICSDLIFIDEND